MTTAIEKITPAIASKMLESNTKNRNMSKLAVTRLAKNMSDGNWKTTHQGIAIDDEGVLIDGQHRLAAIVLSNTTQEMLVTRGMPSNTFKAMDIGRLRSVADLYGTDKKVSQIISRLSMMADPMGQLDKAGLRKYFDVFEEDAVELKNQNNRARAFFSTTSIRALVVLKMKSDPENKQKYIDWYSNIISLDFDNMESSAKCFYRAVVARKLTTDMISTMAWQALSNFEMKRYGKCDTSVTMPMIRFMINSIIDEYGATQIKGL